MTHPTRRAALRLGAASLALPLLALPARAATHRVSIQGGAFRPATLQVAAGDTVVFTNKDSGRHTATADGFDTGSIGGGASASVTIPAGTHNYRCRFHSSMRGTIVAS